MIVGTFVGSQVSTGNRRGEGVLLVSPKDEVAAGGHD